MTDQFEPRVVKGLRKKPVIVEPSTPSATTGAPPTVPTEVEPSSDEVEVLRDYFATQAEIQMKINTVGDLVKRRHGIPHNYSLHFDGKTGKLQVRPPAAS